MWSRISVVVLSGWVLFSGDAWPHSSANRINNAVVGAGLLFFGTLAMRQEWARYVTLALGLWLFAFTVMVSRANPITFWNDAMVAVAVFILSLMGGEGERRPLEPQRPAHPTRRG
jgi:uncharacterized membrane protein YccC